MAEMMDIPIIGLVENFSFMKCPDCGKEIAVFGESKVEALSKELSVDAFAKIPIDPSIAKNVDDGRVFDIEAPWLDGIISKIETYQ